MNYFADNENGAPVPATVPDSGGHRQLECACTTREADQCGADSAAGRPVAGGHGCGHCDAVPEDASARTDDVALYSDYNRCDTPVAAIDAALGRVLD